MFEKFVALWMCLQVTAGVPLHISSAWMLKLPFPSESVSSYKVCTPVRSNSNFFLARDRSFCIMGRQAWFKSMWDHLRWSFKCVATFPFVVLVVGLRFCSHCESNLLMSSCCRELVSFCGTGSWLFGKPKKRYVAPLSYNKRIFISSFRIGLEMQKYLRSKWRCRFSFLKHLSQLWLTGMVNTFWAH